MTPQANDARSANDISLSALSPQRISFRTPKSAFESSQLFPGNPRYHPGQEEQADQVGHRH